MKILIVSDFWQPLNMDYYRGGAESYTMSTWKALMNHGYDAWLLTTKDVEFSHPKLMTWNDLSKESFTRRYPEKRYIPGAEFDSVIPSIKSHNFDVILTSCASVRLVRKIVQCGIPVLHVSHTIIVYRNDPDRFKAFNEIKQSYPLRAITVSNYTKNNINNVVPGYIDDVVYPTYTEYKFCPPITFDSKQLVYTGRVTKTKHVDVLLDNFKDSEFRVLVIGDYQNHSSEYKWYLEVFKPTIEKSPNIIHIPNIPHERLFPIINNSAGLIVPCHDESFSLSAFEAQKLGVPVMHIKSKVGSLEEYVIDGKTGILIDSYRKRKPALREEILHKARDLSTLDRNFIYDHFQDNYSEKKFIDNLLVQLTEARRL